MKYFSFLLTVPWRNYLSVDCRGLAAFRMAIGLLFALDCLMRLADAQAHYSDAGVVPRAARWAEVSLTESLGVWSIFFLDGSTWWSTGLLLAGVAAGLLLALGLRTKAAAFVCWVLALSLRMRMPHVGDGGDVLLQLFFFWGLFLPLGERCSIDRHVHFRRRPPAATVFSGGSIAILLQICFVYWFAAATKTDASWRFHGTALGQALQLESLTTSFGHWIGTWPPLLLQSLTHVTLLVEEMAPVAALVLPLHSPFRAIGACAAILLHLGIACCFTLGIFPWVAIAGWLLFMPSSVYDKAELFLSGQPRDPANRGTVILGSRIADVIATACLVIVGAVLVLALPPLQASLPAPLKFISTATGLQQNWSFFAPRVRSDDGWIATRATLADGSVTDIWQRRSPPTYNEPPSLLDSYRGKRWRQHLSYMFHYKSALMVEAFAGWLQRDWNASNPANPVRTLEIYFVLQNPRTIGPSAVPVRIYPLEATGKKGKAIFASDPRDPAAKKG